MFGWVPPPPPPPEKKVECVSESGQSTDVCCDYDTKYLEEYTLPSKIKLYLCGCYIFLGKATHAEQEASSSDYILTNF